ncbi:MAG: hypothetical protein ACM369_01490 [Acidobacteriota bacterium]
MLDRLNTSATRPVAVELLNPTGARLAGEALGFPVGDWAIVVGFEDNAASVAWQVDRLMIELGRTNIAIREGADAAPLWSSLTEFQAAEVGPVSFVANLRPSTVAPFVRGLDPDRWAVQTTPGTGSSGPTRSAHPTCRRSPPRSTGSAPRPTATAAT